MIFWQKNDMFNDILAQQLMIFLPKINDIFFFGKIIISKYYYCQKYCNSFGKILIFWLTSKI